MRVVRIKHKAGLAIFVVIFLIVLYVLISKHSGREVQVLNEDGILNMPTRTVDFVDIAKNVPVKTDKDGKRQDHLLNPPLSRGKLKSNFRKQPRPPKRRISDGIVDKAVIKNVVHGDALFGPSKGNSHRQSDKARPLVPKRDEKGIFIHCW